MVVGTVEAGRTHPLYRDLLADATFHQLLLACDGDLADIARAGRCGLCGGTLHSACYPRKPRGRPCRLGPEHDRRFSFCCAVDGCRSRATPPSLRFLGRKVYLAAIVVLVATLRHGVTTARLERLSQAVGVDRRTVERWRTWWRDGFTATPFWQVAAPRSYRQSTTSGCRHRSSNLHRRCRRSSHRAVALHLAPSPRGRVHV
jgi:hypothetical protein